MLKNLLFDLDGTLTDSSEGITKCVQYALKGMGIDEPDLSKFYKFIGPPLRASFEKYYGFSKEQAEEATGKYRERFHNIGIYENKPYPYMLELIKKLKQKNISMGMATGKPQIYAVPIVERFGFAPYFTAKVGSSIDGSMDNKALVVAEALRQMQITTIKEKDVTLMIGDRQEDVFAAHSNGIKCIGVGYGFGSKEELQNASVDYYVKDINELEMLLQKLM